MPDEVLITEIESILNQVVELGAATERTRLAPNLLVRNDSPGPDGFILVRDDRDGDNILARTVPGVIYNTNDLVNVLFVRGGEAIAFQQGSESGAGGNLWGIVSGTSTDIFYNSGDVGIGKTVAPDARLELLDTAQAQLRLTFQEDTKFADFTLDTSHNLTIDPSSTGLIKLNATVTIPDELQHEGDSDTKIGFTDDDIEFTVGNLSMLKLTEAAQDLITLGPGSGDVDINFNGDMFLQGSDGFFGVGTASPDRLINIEASSRFPLRVTSTDAGALVGPIFEFLRDSSSPAVDDDIGELRFQGNDAGDNVTTYAEIRGQIANPAEGSESGRLKLLTTFNNDASLVRVLINESGDVGMATDFTATPAAQLHIDQSSSTAAQPVLYLDQADVDEPFTKYVGSAAAATLTRSIVAEADVTTATRQGFVKIEIEDIGNQVTDQDYFVPFFTLA